MPGNQKTKSRYYLLTLIKWVVNNYGMEWIKKRYPLIPFIHIRYEDLCMQTEKTMRSICNYFELDYLKNIEKPKNYTELEI